MDSFDQYEKATQMGNGGTETKPPEAPKLPGPDSPPRIQAPQTQETFTKVKGWLDQLKTLLILIVLVLVVLFLSSLLWKQFHSLTNLVETPKTIVREVPVQIAIPDESLEKELKKTQGDANWLRHLLRKEKENHATTKARLQNALQERSADEKYHRFLKYALNQFYSQPFKKGEGSRTICFTTDSRDRKCYQLDRPTGWFEGRTILPTPVKLRQL